MDKAAQLRIEARDADRDADEADWNRQRFKADLYRTQAKRLRAEADYLEGLGDVYCPDF